MFRISFGAWLAVALGGMAVQSCTCSGAPAGGTAPTIEAIDPAVMIIAEPVRVSISGHDLRVPIRVRISGGELPDETPLVTIGGLPCTGVVLQEPTLIEADASASLPIGAHDVVVRLPSGYEAILKDGFEVIAPVTAELAAPRELAVGESGSATLTVTSVSGADIAVAIAGAGWTAPEGVVALGAFSLPAATVPPGGSIEAITTVGEIGGALVARVIDIGVSVRWSFGELGGQVEATSDIEILPVSVCAADEECFDVCRSGSLCAGGRCQPGPVNKDSDGDGSYDAACDGGDDCDDDPAGCGAGCNPGLAGADVCDGADNDCDESIDEDPELRWYADVDGDGYGDPNTVLFACAQPAAYVADDSDCADQSGSDPDCNHLDGARCNPGLAGADVCDGANNDCDGSVDEDPELRWYADADGDGYGDPGIGQDSCNQPAGYVSDASDCADTPGSDPNCNNLAGSRCNPGLAGYDICDGANNDCDELTDEDPDTVWYADGDGDSFGNPGVALSSCAQPPGYVANDDDCADTPGSDPACNDLDGSLCNPGLTGSDFCDGANNDCDGAVDEDSEITWYADADGDGYGDPSVAQASCAQPLGYVSDNSDCADMPGSDPNCGNLDGALCNPGRG